MPLHVYTLWVKAVTPQGERWLPISGPFMNAAQKHAPLSAVLKWLDEQRDALRAEILRAREMGASIVRVTAHLPVPNKEGPSVGNIDADSGDPLEELKRVVRKHYQRES